MSSLTVLKALPSGFNMDFSLTDGALEQAFQETTIMLKILTGVVSTLVANPESMREKLDLGFSTATELADTIVRDKGLSFRTAHKIVGTLTKVLFERKIQTSAINSKLIDEASKAITGEPLMLTEEQIKAALNPQENIAKRKSRGGPAPEEVKRMIMDRSERIANHQRENDQLKKSQEQVANRLRTEALEIIREAESHSRGKA